jgi:hypothetical protein
LEEIKNLLGMSIYLQGGYTFNFNNPDSMTNEQRIFDKKANTFLIDLAQIQFAKDAPVGGLGYKLNFPTVEGFSGFVGQPTLTEQYNKFIRRQILVTVWRVLKSYH